MRCPHCKNKLLQKSGSSTRLRTDGPIEFDDTGEAKTKCFWCKSVVDVPIALKDPVLESERLVIRKSDDKSDA